MKKKISKKKKIKNLEVTVMFMVQQIAELQYEINWLLERKCENDQ